jgi:hypothetical protein
MSLHRALLSGIFVLAAVVTAALCARALEALHDIDAAFWGLAAVVQFQAARLWLPRRISGE